MKKTTQLNGNKITLKNILICFYRKISKRFQADQKKNLSFHIKDNLIDAKITLKITYSIQFEI